jgi:putative membrane protein
MIFGAVFAMLNSDTVEVNYHFGRQDLPLSLVMTLMLGLGVILGALAAIFRIVRLKRDIQVLKKRSELVSKEVSNLRTLPLNE